MNRISLILMIAMACAMFTGCATSRDTQAVSIHNASLLPMEKEYQIKFIPDVGPGAKTVFVRKQNATGYCLAHTKERYERFAFELQPDTPILDRMDINADGINFRYTRGQFDGPWQYNSSQRGYLYIHRETEDTIELCLDLKVSLKWGQTYKHNSVESASSEAGGNVEIKRFFVFSKNNLEAYTSSNNVPKTLKYLETAD